jgi:hypothetical protein
MKHTTEPFIGLLMVSCFSFLQGLAVESLVARFMDYWMPRSVRRPRAAVKVVRQVFYVIGLIFLLIAVLYKIGIV